MEGSKVAFLFIIVGLLNQNFNSSLPSEVTGLGDTIDQYMAEKIAEFGAQFYFVGGTKWTKQRALIY